MCRKITVCILTIFVFLLAAAVPCYGEGHPAIVWQASRLGKLTSLVMGPNKLLYVSSGNKLMVVDDHGQKLWEAAVAGGGKGGRPVFDACGSIFFSGGSSVQELKLNGSNGWDFTVYDGNNSDTQVTFGPGNLLYLPLPSGLYALDTEGHYKWLMQVYESQDAINTQTVSGREILACAGNDQAIFVVIGKKGKGNILLAISGEGTVLWRYWLGDIKEVSLVTGSDGRLYVAVITGQSKRSTPGKVYAFDSNGDGKPLWYYPVKFDNLTAPTPSKHGQLYFCADNKLFALNQADGKESWRVTLYKTVSCPAFDESSRHVYLGTDDSRLLAVTLQGRLDWDLTLDGKITGQPLTGPGGIVYVSTDKGSLYKIKDEAYSGDQ
ncbi:PQQ-binding-like beta-propeller repeat protein [Pelotomaculum propionicicum]|uniref:Desiccation/radiation resistance protein n=1 Tax=Pelotomaculum propionicicum TaxID=258475 RepID=A0A4Y7RTZ1_9FIRM|nr:PQQ-binding-like beta-propeller repeat protein [Pelotomaculum propionicicum]NLI13504.1 PQQ-binding-like beta-propeller repeat protein [Peptococcaceae bacterium]TEB12199.1 Desiccation/radiation resistance protein [Pelotomaculum propionicicum]